MSEWQHGFAFNPLRKHKLCALSDDQIKGLHKDFNAARTYHGRMCEAFRRSINELNREISLRQIDEQETVTDHALVRFLERHKGMNVDEIRDKIRKLDGDIAPRNGNRITTVLSASMIK